MKFYDKNKPFADQLKLARKKLGLSQMALSKELELPIRTIGMDGRIDFGKTVQYERKENKSYEKR